MVNGYSINIAIHLKSTLDADQNQTNFMACWCIYSDYAVNASVRHKVDLVGTNRTYLLIMLQEIHLRDMWYQKLW